MMLASSIRLIAAQDVVQAPAATRSDLDALAGQLRGEIRDVARALTMTRDVREAMTGIQTSQGQTSDALHRLEQASESLAITTDYLVALAEEDDGFAEDEELQATAAVFDIWIVKGPLQLSHPD